MNSKQGNGLQRKMQLLMKEYDTAYTSYARHSSQIVSLRGWSITLLLAYFGLLQAIGSNGLKLVVIIPAGLILGGFIVLEALEKCFARLNVDNVLEIQQQSVQGSDEQFERWVEAYEFRDHRIRRLRRREKARLLLGELGGFQTLLWYSFLGALFWGMLVTVKRN